MLHPKKYFLKEIQVRISNDNNYIKTILPQRDTGGVLSNCEGQLTLTGGSRPLHHAKEDRVPESILVRNSGLQPSLPQFLVNMDVTEGGTLEGFPELIAFPS